MIYGTPPPHPAPTPLPSDTYSKNSKGLKMLLLDMLSGIQPFRGFFPHLHPPYLHNFLFITKKDIFLHRESHLSNELTISNVIQNVTQMTCYPAWHVFISFPASLFLLGPKRIQGKNLCLGFYSSRWLSQLEDTAAFSSRSCVLFWWRPGGGLAHFQRCYWEQCFSDSLIRKGKRRLPLRNVFTINCM